MTQRDDAVRRRGTLTRLPRPAQSLAYLARNRVKCHRLNCGRAHDNIGGRE